MPNTTRQWIYARPLDKDKLGPQHFELREVALPELKDGEALVRVKLINIHSNTRMRMSTQAVPLGETDAANYACAEVIESRTPTFKKGDIIACQTGWQEYQVISTRGGSRGIRSRKRTYQSSERNELSLDLQVPAGHGEDVACGSADGHVRNLGNDGLFWYA